VFLNYNFFYQIIELNVLLNKAVLVVKYNAHLLNQLLFRNYKH